MSTSFQNDREHKTKIPAFMILNPQKVAAKLERVIYRRRKKVYMHKWMLFLMKIKKLNSR